MTFEKLIDIVSLLAVFIVCHISLRTASRTDGGKWIQKYSSPRFWGKSIAEISVYV